MKEYLLTYIEKYGNECTKVLECINLKEAKKESNEYLKNIKGKLISLKLKSILKPFSIKSKSNMDIGVWANSKRDANKKIKNIGIKLKGEK